METTNEMNHRIIGMLQRTWDAIADDVLILEEEWMIDRDTVIEMVCDADRYETHGGDKAAAALFRDLLRTSSKEKDTLLSAAFPEEHYGY